MEDEGPDGAWLEAESARRREVWEAGRAVRRQQARERRRSETLAKRVHRLEVMLALSATAPAAAISGGGGGTKPDSQIPPAAEVSFSGEHPRELQRLLRLLEATVERLEALADAEPGPVLDSTDIDRSLVEDYEGYTAEDASALEPRFGSPEAVRRARRNAGRAGNDGTKKL
jgi:hypothetical protein